MKDKAYSVISFLDHYYESNTEDILSASLKNLMIMLYPFAPQMMEKMRESLNLPETVWSMEELGTGLSSGHGVN